MFSTVSSSLRSESWLSTTLSYREREGGEREEGARREGKRGLRK
jgi:hypothetical protein